VQGLAFEWPSNGSSQVQEPSAYHWALLGIPRASTGWEHGKACRSDCSSRSVVLLGEGDFSFTAAVLQKRSQNCSSSSNYKLISSSYEKEDQLLRIYPGSAVLQRLTRIAAAGESC
jgi:hypothetical protein